MTSKDILEETLTSLRANKVRSGLTMLGIIIGISSVIAMISIGEGAKKSIQTSIEGLGSNLLTIVPGVLQPGRGIISSGRGSAQTLKNSDVAELEKIYGIAAVAPELSRRFQITAGTGYNTNSTVTGTVPAYETVRSLVVLNGNFLRDSSIRSYAREAVLGATVATDLFADQDPIGKSIRINKTNFQVIGVLKAKGGAGFSGPDDIVIIPLLTMQKILAGSDFLSTIAVSVTDKNDMNAVREQATDILISQHRITEPDFSIISQEDIIGTLSSVINTFTLFLASIASISLVVGGIGIMNMMLTTVTERTREIGLRKAIGATRSDINRQFLAEAVVLTLLGGVLGVMLGSSISYAVTYFGIVQTSVSISSVLLAFGVSGAIGIAFGYYPARRASKLNPIEALRYE